MGKSDRCCIRHQCYGAKIEKNHKYHFRVAAENKQGVGEALETEESVLAKNPFDEPDAPDAPEVLDHDRDFVLIRLKPPQRDGGAPIKGYIVERKETKSNRWIRINRNLFKDLELEDDTVREGKEYEFRVFAVNEAGASEPSSFSLPVLAKAKQGSSETKFEFIGLWASQRGSLTSWGEAGSVYPHQRSSLAHCKMESRE